jgi:hypothetical protein
VAIDGNKTVLFLQLFMIISRKTKINHTNNKLILCQPGTVLKKAQLNPPSHVVTYGMLVGLKYDGAC